MAKSSPKVAKPFLGFKYGKTGRTEVSRLPNNRRRNSKWVSYSAVTKTKERKLNSRVKTGIYSGFPVKEKNARR